MPHFPSFSQQSLYCANTIEPEANLSQVLGGISKTPHLTAVPVFWPLLVHRGQHRAHQLFECAPPLRVCPLFKRLVGT